MTQEQIKRIKQSINETRDILKVVATKEEWLKSEENV